MKLKLGFVVLVSCLFSSAILVGFLLFPGAVPRMTSGSPRVGSRSIIAGTKADAVRAAGPLPAQMSSVGSVAGRPRIVLGVAVDGEDPLDIEELQEKVLLDMDFINVMNDGGTGQVDSTKTKRRLLLFLKVAATRPELVELMNEVGYISENYAKTEDMESKRKMVARLKECRTELKKALFQQAPTPSSPSDVGVSGGATAAKPLSAPGETEKPKTFQ